MKKTKGKHYHPVIDNLRKIMIDKHLTQQGIGALGGISSSQISKVFNGNVGISIEQLENIATSLDMRLIDLFTYPTVYVPIEETKPEDITASITIQLKKEKKEQVLKLVFGDSNLELLNK